MITRFLAVAGRNGRALLTTGLALSAGHLVVQARMPSLAERTFPAMWILAATLLTLAVVSVAARRPDAFVVLPDVPAFSTPPRPRLVFVALTYLVVATGMVGNVIRDWGTDPFEEQLIGLLWAVVALLHVAAAWCQSSVQLRPDGLWQRGVTGRLVIPWDASPTVPSLPPDPRANSVPLTCARPELARRRGLHGYRKALRTTDIQPWLLTAAIRHYVANPGARAAIGTAAERDRLAAELPDPFRAPA